MLSLKSAFQLFTSHMKMDKTKFESESECISEMLGVKDYRYVLTYFRKHWHTMKLHSTIHNVLEKLKADTSDQYKLNKYEEFKEYNDDYMRLIGSAQQGDHVEWCIRKLFSHVHCMCYDLLTVWPRDRIEEIIKLYYDVFDESD